MSVFSPLEIAHIMSLKEYVYKRTTPRYFPYMFHHQILAGNMVFGGPFLLHQLAEIKGNGISGNSVAVIYLLDKDNMDIWGNELGALVAKNAWNNYIKRHSEYGGMRYQTYYMNTKHPHVPGINIDLNATMRGTVGDSKIRYMTVVLTDAKTKDEMFENYFTTRPNLYCTGGKLYVTRDAYDGAVV